MKFIIINSLFLMCAGFFLSSAIVDAAVVSQVETSASAGQDGNEAFDADLAFQVSQTDLLNGLVPTLSSAAPHAAYPAANLTDGDGPSRNFSSDSTGVTFLSDNATTVEWTGLLGISIYEIRVFGYGIDDRSLMEYTIEINSGNGYTLIDTVDNGSGGPVGVSNGTNLVRTFDDSGAPLATGVIGIRIIYQDNYTGSNGAAIGEIDAIGSPPLTPGNTDGTWINPLGGGWLTGSNWNLATAANGAGKVARFDTLNLTADATVQLDSARSLGKLIFGDTSPSHGWKLTATNLNEPLTLSDQQPSIEVLDGTTKIDVQITGNNGLEKTGGGTLELNRPNTYTGLTKISSGTLSLKPALRISAFGDSITYGSQGTNGGYRGPLYNLLSPYMPNFQFIGATATKPDSLPLDQRYHNGYASYPTLILSNNLDGLDTDVFTRFGGTSRDPRGGYWFVGGNGTGRSPQYPDMALLLVGANDIFWGEGGFRDNISAADYAVNLRNLIDKIQTLRPHCHVIVARISPWPAKTQEVAGINQDVDSVVATLIGEGRKVSKVDLNTGFPANGLSSDHLHPADPGYNWMAGKWFEAIKKAMPLMLPNNSSVEVAAGANFMMENQSLSLGSLTGNGDVKIGGGTLTVGGANSTFTFGGAITGNGVFVKTGNGIASLTGANHYEGNTRIDAGTLELTQATLADASSVLITSGATLKLTHTAVDTVGALIVNGTPVADGVYGALDSNAPNRVSYIIGMGKLRVGASNYSTWSNLHAGGQAAALDFDQDGMPNLVEFFMGETGTAMTKNPVSVNGKVTWSRNPAALVAGFEVEFSNDLVTWASIPHDDPAMAITPTSISFEMPSLTASQTRYFYRLKINQ